MKIYFFNFALFSLHNLTHVGIHCNNDTACMLGHFKFFRSIKKVELCYHSDKFN